MPPLPSPLGCSHVSPELSVGWRSSLWYHQGPQHQSRSPWRVTRCHGTHTRGGTHRQQNTPAASDATRRHEQCSNMGVEGNRAICLYNVCLTARLHAHANTHSLLHGHACTHIQFNAVTGVHIYANSRWWSLHAYIHALQWHIMQAYMHENRNELKKLQSNGCDVCGVIFKNVQLKCISMHKELPIYSSSEDAAVRIDHPLNTSTICTLHLLNQQQQDIAWR